MSKVTYIACDICGNKVYSDGLKTMVKGERYYPLLSGSYKVDICGDCILKISELVNKEKEAKQ